MVAFRSGKGKASISLLKERSGSVNKYLVRALAACVLLVASVANTAVAAQPGFGIDGLMVTKFDNFPNAAGRDIRIDHAGRIVVSGVVGERDVMISAEQFGLARYLPNGVLDRTFGVAGRAISDFGGSGVHPENGLRIDNQHRLVVAGGATNVVSGQNSFSLARFNSNGIKDITFGVDGKVSTVFPDSSFNSAKDLVITNGGVLAVGETDLGPQEFALVNYLPDGNLNAAFGSSGLIATIFSSHPDWSEISAVATDVRGRFVVAGQVIERGVSAFAVARYLADGTLDKSFNDSGLVVINFDQVSQANGVAIDAYGRIVVVGNALMTGRVLIEGSCQGFAVARLGPDGRLDASFGNNGGVVTQFPNESGCAHDVAIDRRGRIVVAGFAVLNGRQHFAAARYDANGDLDRSFGVGGTVTTAFPSQVLSQAHAVTIDRQGRIFLAGQMNDGRSTTFFAVACYNDNGFPCRDLPYEYTAKLVCGQQQDTRELRLARGVYATTVNIHNPHTQPVRFFKKLALSVPSPKGQAAGQVLPIAEERLFYGEAVASDCEGLRRRLFPGGFPGGYIEGYTVIQSPSSLDVTAVYSTAALDDTGMPGRHSGINVERIPERLLSADIEVQKNAELVQFQLADSLNLHTVLYTLQATNRGPSAASNVQLFDELALQSTNAIATIEILEAPIDLPSAAQIVNIIEATPTASLQVSLGDLASGETKSVRFWALIGTYATAAPASAHVRNTVTISSDVGDVDLRNNSATLETVLIP